MSINVTITDATNVSVAVGGSLATSPLTALQVTAGANITITTTSGVYTFIGPNVPVQSVNGQTGTVVLNLANLTAAAASHTHVMSDITDLAYPVNVVNGQTGTVLLTSTDVSAASAVHTHVASEITNLTSVANVVSVNGQTGVAVLNSTNVSAASAVHTHVMADVTDLAFPVSSVNGYTGVVALTIDDITAASATHTHSMAEVADITFPVNSVNGQTGTVVLTNVDVSAAAASHTHAASEVTDLTSVANVISVNGQTGVVTITLGDALPAQAGNATNVLTTDGTAASWATRYSVVEPVLVAGTGMSFSKDTSAGSITIEADGGIVGSTAAAVSTKALSADQNDYDAGSSDIVRLTPSANVTLTGLAGGSDGVVRVLYNVGTHVVTLSSGNTNSVETNRFSIASGNAVLSEGDSSSVWYDGTSQRWRVLEDQVAGGSGGSGGGIAMSYLFG